MTTNDADDNQLYECPTCDYTADTEKKVEVHRSKTHRKGSIETECDFCGSDIEVQRNMYERSERNFCNPDCYGSWQSENLNGEKTRGEYKQIEIECEWCGDTRLERPKRIERANNNFCSKECHDEWQRTYFHGERHPLWEGGSRDYGPGWSKSLREEVRDEYERKCADCGITEIQHQIDTNKKLNVHHMVPPGENINPAVSNAKRNLVALCLPCHRAREMKNSIQTKFV